MNTDTQPAETAAPFDGLFSAIVPCRDEAEALPLFYAEFTRVMAQMHAENFELVFVDDGSTDATLSEIKKLAQADARVKFISFSRNFGKEAAMFAGFRAAKGDFVAVMDADLQDPPALLPQMFQMISDCDCVATARKSRDDEPAVRAFFSRLFYRCMNAVSPLKFRSGARDFRLMRRRAVNELLRLGEYNRFTKGFYEWIGFDVKWLEFDNVPRAVGKTKWSFWGLLLYSIEAFTSFSAIPLITMSVLGLFFCAFSAAAIIFLSVRQLIFHNSAFGWTSMVCILFFLSGLQLFCLGILGQYVSKIYLETKHRPHYIIKEKA